MPATNINHVLSCHSFSALAMALSSLMRPSAFSIPFMPRAFGFTLWWFYFFVCPEGSPHRFCLPSSKRAFWLEGRVGYRMTSSHQFFNRIGPWCYLWPISAGSSVAVESHPCLPSAKQCLHAVRGSRRKRTGTSDVRKHLIPLSKKKKAA